MDVAGAPCHDGGVGRPLSFCGCEQSASLSSGCPKKSPLPNLIESNFQAFWRERIMRIKEINKGINRGTRMSTLQLSRGDDGIHEAR